jgi:hypothetical protein
MTRRAGRIMGAIVFGALALSAGSVGTATAATSDGYQRVPVEGAPLTIAVPDDWELRPITRAGAKVILKENPQLADQGVTVEQLLATPLTTGWDADGDGYFDRYLTVQLTDAPSLPSPSELESGFAAQSGVSDVEATRTTVAKKPAMLVEYTQSLSRDDGAPLIAYGTTYMFFPRAGHAVMLQFFRTSEADAELPAIARTMVKSVKLR